MSEIMKLPEIAAFLNVSKITIMRYVRKGMPCLQACKGAPYGFIKEDAVNFCKAQARSRFKKG